MVDSSPTRVLMTADTVGGVWTYALDLARGLAPLGVEVALATMGAPLSSAQHATVERLGNVTLFESGYKLEWMDDPWADVEAAGDWLLELEACFAPDLIHLNGFSHGALPWKAPSVVVAHSCVVSWWSTVKKEAAPARYDRYRQKVSEGLHGADIVVAPTEAMLSTLYGNYGTFPRARVILNGRNAGGFVPGRKKAFVMAAGRLWDEAKNIALLDKVAPRLDWPIYVAGQAQHPDGLGSEFKNVRLLGLLDADKLAGWLSDAAIYVLPARYEPFGLSALEAGLCGCALVLGDIPSLREVWGDAAFFVPPDDVDAICGVIGALIASGHTRQEMGARARRRASQFTHHSMAAAYSSLYSELTQNREAREVAP